MRLVEIEGRTASREWEPTMTKDTENPNQGGRVFEEHLQDGITVDNKQKTRHRSPAGKNTFNVEVTEGDDLYRDTGKWNKLRRKVDRQGNNYQERIIDSETGEVIRDVNERLDQHKGHGGARKK